MNQKTIIVIAAIIIFLICLFPPWVQTFRPRELGEALIEDAGYHCIISPPSPTGEHKEYKSIKLDYRRWFMQVVGVSVLAGAILFIIRKKE